MCALNKMLFFSTLFHPYLFLISRLKIRELERKKTLDELNKKKLKKRSFKELLCGCGHIHQKKRRSACK